MVFFAAFPLIASSWKWCELADHLVIGFFIEGIGSLSVYSHGADDRDSERVQGGHSSL